MTVRAATWQRDSASTPTDHQPNLARAFCGRPWYGPAVLCSELVSKRSPREVALCWRDCMIRGICKQLGFAFFVVGAFVSATRGDAAHAFPKVSADLSTPLDRAGVEVLEERLVHIARGELDSVRDQVASWGIGPLLNVDADVELCVAVEQTVPMRSDYSLSERVDDPAMEVTSAVHDDTVAGPVWMPVASHEVVHLIGCVQAVREVATNVRQCGGALPSSEAQPFVWPEHPCWGRNTVVDVLPSCTPKREELTGEVSVQAGIELGIAYANDNSEHARAFAPPNLIGAERAIEREEPDVDHLNARRTTPWMYKP